MGQMRWIFVAVSVLLSAPAAASRPAGTLVSGWDSQHKLALGARASGWMCPPAPGGAGGHIQPEARAPNASLCCESQPETSVPAGLLAAAGAESSTLTATKIHRICPICPPEPPPARVIGPLMTRKNTNVGAVTPYPLPDLWDVAAISARVAPVLTRSALASALILTTFVTVGCGRNAVFGLGESPDEQDAHRHAPGLDAIW